MSVISIDARNDFPSPDAAVTIRAKDLKSKSKNTPFDGWQLKGAVAATFVGGRMVYKNEAL